MFYHESKNENNKRKINTAKMLVLLNIMSCAHC